MSVCRRSAGILDTWLEAGQVRDRDARHLARCRRCADAFARVDVADAEIRSAARALVFEASAVGIGPTAPERHPPDRIAVDGLRPANSTVRFRAGLASLVAIVVLAVVAGIRLSSAPVATPGAAAEPLLPVAVGPAEQALHQSGLRCAEIDTGLECTRRLSDGWRQVARLEVAGGAVQGLEVRLVPGTGAFPVADAPAALSEPAVDVLGVDVAEAVDEALDAGGVACGCTRSIDGGAIHVEGDPVAGYLLVIEGPDGGLPVGT
jgi:hypothetical protein